MADIDAGPDTVRYVVRPEADGGACWTRHGAAAAQACLGRSRSGGSVDGVYLTGHAQLSYLPLTNLRQPHLAPAARRLKLPGERPISALAACRGADDTTDLYAIAQGGLFYFSSTNQSDRAQALPLTEHVLFHDIRRLFAATAKGRVTVWGLNEAGQVIHTCVDEALAAEGSAWSAPTVVLADVLAIAPCADDILFARTSTSLIRTARSAEGGNWTSLAIAPTPGVPAAGGRAWMAGLLGHQQPAPAGADS